MPSGLMQEFACETNSKGIFNHILQQQHSPLTSTKNKKRKVVVLMHKDKHDYFHCFSTAVNIITVIIITIIMWYTGTKKYA